MSLFFIWDDIDANASFLSDDDIEANVTFLSEMT